VLASHLLPEARAGPGSQKGPRLFFGILHDKAHIADTVNATVITLDEAPQGYKDFDKG
jgi:hypothetical protein